MMRTEFMKVKLVLSLISLVVGAPALVFALFGWNHTGYALFGDYARYTCIVGSLGAMLMGSLLLNETVTIQRTVTLAKKPALDFGIKMDYEGNKKTL
jgi:uncharacterized membrane protein YdcZ (DUF606 family)